MSNSFKKYTPPSLRDTEENVATPSSRWTYTSRAPNGEEQQLRNTSAAARLAPELAPSIIAPTRSNGLRSLGTSAKAPKVSLTSEEEFPTMGKKVAPTTATAWGGSKPSFAELSRTWADKQKKEQEEEKLQAEKELMIERERRAQKEKEEKELRAHQQLHRVAHLGVADSDEDRREYDIGGSRDRYDLAHDSPESDSYDDEEVDDEVVDDTWESHRNKHDYY